MRSLTEKPLPTNSTLEGKPMSLKSCFLDTSRKEASKQKRTISFSPYARMLSVESRSDLSEEEHKLTWWSDEEFADVQKTTVKLVRCMLNFSQPKKSWVASSTSTEAAVIPPTSTREAELGSNNSPPLSRQIQAMSPKRQLSSAEVEQDESIVVKKTKAAKTVQTEPDFQIWWRQYGEVAFFLESRKRQMQAKKSIRLVIDEFMRRRVSNDSKASSISNIYREATTWARDWAITLAQACAEEINGSTPQKAHGKMTLSSLLSITTVLSKVGVPSVQTRALPTTTSICSSQISRRSFPHRACKKKDDIAALVRNPSNKATCDTTTIVEVSSSGVPVSV